MPDLKVSFEFLCAFVPQKPFYPETTDRPREVTVLLRDLRNPPATFVSDPNVHPVPHIAYLQFDGRDRKPHTDPANAAASDRPVNDSEGNIQVFTLDQEEITFHPDGHPPVANRLNPLNKTPMNAVQPSTIDEHKYLWWLAGMERVDPARTHVKPSLLSGAVHDPRIAARIKLTEGDLFAGRATPTPWILKHKSSQILALSVVYKLSFTSFVDIKLARFDGSAETWLRLQPGPGQATVFAFIRNSEVAYRFGDGRDSYGKRDLDFEHYYDLADANTPGSPRPVPNPAVPLDSDHSACAPLAFSS